MTARRLLVIEDDADQRLGLGIRLRAAGYAVTFSGDGASAMSAAQRDRPDLIILDLGLPGGDGFTVLERLRANLRFAGTPVIVITARDPTTTRARAEQLGAFAFLQKPVDNDELLQAIRGALDGAS